MRTKARGFQSTPCTRVSDRKDGDYGIWTMGAAPRATEVHKSLNNIDLVSCQTGHLNDWQAGRNCLMRQQDYCSMKESWSPCGLSSAFYEWITWAAAALSGESEFRYLSHYETPVRAGFTRTVTRLMADRSLFFSLSIARGAIIIAQCTCNLINSRMAEIWLKLRIIEAKGSVAMVSCRRILRPFIIEGILSIISYILSDREKEAELRENNQKQVCLSQSFWYLIP